MLSRSRIPGADFCINPYVGCSHACKYCYATFMARYSQHVSPWGTFVDAKINAPEVLEEQLRRGARGAIMISSVTDAYQPLEARYRLTRRCLEKLRGQPVLVDILTKSPLVVRDIEILKQLGDASVGMTITTDDEKMRKIFEPGAPPIGARLAALGKLRESGIRTYAFIGPVLPMNPRKLCTMLERYVEYIFIDTMNYEYKTEGLYARLGLKRWLAPEFLQGVVHELSEAFGSSRAIVCDGGLLRRAHGE